MAGVACTFDDQRLGGDLPQLAESSLRLRPGDDVVPHLVEKHHFTFLLTTHKDLYVLWESRVGVHI